MKAKDLADMDLRDLKLEQLLGELRDVGNKSANELLRQGRDRARRVLGAPGGGQMATALVIGIAIGAAIGATVALLVTPMAGREARQRVSQGVSRIKEQVPEWQRGGDGSYRQQPLGSAPRGMAEGK